MFRFLALASAATIATTFPAAPALAAPADATLALAQEHLADGRADLACSVLDGEVITASVEALLLLGLCNEQLGNFESAISYYERTLRIVPEASLVRARLAALYLLVGQSQQAEAQLQTAMTTALVSAARDPSPTAVPNATGQLSVNRFYDSNINGGSSSTTMTGIVFGTPLPMVINPSSRSMADSGTSVSVRGRHLTPLGPNYALLLSASLGAKIHDNRSQYDRQTGGFATALLYRDGAVSAMIQPSIQFAFEGGELDMVGAGLGGMAKQELGHGISLVAASEIAYRRNPEVVERSAWDGRLSLGLGYALTENFEVGVSYGTRSTKSGRPTESYFAHGPELGLNWMITDRASFGLSYGYEFATYQETSALFPADRVEDRHLLAAELNIDLSDQAFEGVGLAARYEFSVTDSTLPLYDNERHAASVGLTYSF